MSKKQDTNFLNDQTDLKRNQGELQEIKNITIETKANVWIK